MRHEIKKQLKIIYEAPPPLRKKEFLRKWGQPRMNLWKLLLLQAAYIRKWIWGISAVIFAVAVSGAVAKLRNLVWMISALTPLLAVTVITECGRSERCEMAELEMATRFSLRSVLFARLGILGMENLAVLTFLLIVGIKNADVTSRIMGRVEAGVCILMPYLLTSLMGLYITRRYKGQEAAYFCVGGAVCIGVSVFLFRDTLMQIYQKCSPLWWGVIVFLLCAGVIRQYSGMIHRTEELT
ncbi:MAG: hypothetical protein NC548_41915 [Lachnospiraceae bacterium]|nr:hypothetical protein [Lachnospiraceae bacterium]